MMRRKLLPRAKDFFKIILKDKQRKSLPKILFEFSKYCLTDQALAEQYFSKYLYRKSALNPNDYIVTRKITAKCWDLNNKDYSLILKNKKLSELFFVKNNIRVVKSLAQNFGTIFISGTDFLQLNSAGEFRDFLQKIMKESVNGNGIFIKKNCDSCGGKNTFMISAEQILNTNSNFESVYKNLISSEYIFQEILIQHNDLNKLNPTCINTLRLDTFTNNKSETKILSGFLRLGLGNGIVDNVSSGGVYVAIKPGEGILNCEGYSDFTHGKGRTYKSHPLTNQLFEGFKLPFYEEAERLVIDAAQKIPQVKIIGWDVAFLPDGPVIIEGNGHPGLHFSEIGQKGFRNNPVFSEMYSEAIITES